MPDLSQIVLDVFEIGSAIMTATPSVIKAYSPISEVIKDSYRRYLEDCEELLEDSRRLYTRGILPTEPVGTFPLD